MRSPSYRIVDYHHGWPASFEEERALVVAATGIAPKRVENVGSTAVPGLAAKPVIDLMVGVPRVEDAQRQIDALRAMGYDWRGEKTSCYSVTFCGLILRRPDSTKT